MLPFQFWDLGGLIESMINFLEELPVEWQQKWEDIKQQKLEFRKLNSRPGEEPLISMLLLFDVNFYFHNPATLPGLT